MFCGFVNDGAMDKGQQMSLQHNAWTLCRLTVLGEQGPFSKVSVHQICDTWTAWSMTSYPH